MTEVSGLPERSEVAASDQWDLSGLYADESAWDADFETIDAQIEKLAAFKGTLAKGPARLKRYLELQSETSRLLYKLYTYAHCRMDEDTTNSTYTGMMDKLGAVQVKVGEATAFFRPELLGQSKAALDKLLRSKTLGDWHYYLEQIIRFKPHTLSVKEERLMALAGEITRAPWNAFSALSDADLDFGTCEDADGNEVAVTHGAYISVLSKPDRTLRKNFFDRYYEGFEAHKHTLAATLGAAIKRDVFNARARNFESSRQAALFDNMIPEAVYDNLVDSVRANLDPLHRYYDLRKRTLGLKEVHFYDLFVPLVDDVAVDLPYEEAVALLGEAFAPLGPRYTEVVTQGMLGGWVDRYENKGKRGGAYSGGCYDSDPFILMNYQSDALDSCYTLAHEAGHSMHSYYSRAKQPPQYAGYSIFVAEVASTFNEALLTAHLLEKWDDPRQRAYLVSKQLDDLRGTLFRQVMFADFEHQLHARAEAGEGLALDDITGLYHGILETYFGPDFTLDPALDLECLRIPHFYFNYYVFQYATGISAATALSREVLAGNKAALRRYLSFLSAGGSDYPIDVLRTAGVDMERPDAVEATLAHFDELVTQLEVELTALKKSEKKSGKKDKGKKSRKDKAKKSGKKDKSKKSKKDKAKKKKSKKDKGKKSKK